MRSLVEYTEEFFEQYLKFPNINVIDVIEIIIIAFVVYQIMVWIKRTRAWSLFKGILVLVVFMLVATFFNFNTLLWLIDRTLSVGIIALVIIFQPELRKALEELGRNNILTGAFSFDKRSKTERFSDKTIEEIMDAVWLMARHRTGALIVIEMDELLDDIINTGIEIDSVISSQLLVNIFEHNTPLHDGAVVIREDRVAAATCYLPLSENMSISKDHGTRHRAGLGVSEISDSLTIIVSEETGRVSIAHEGQLQAGVDKPTMRNMLISAQDKPEKKEKPKKEGRRSVEKKA